MMLFSGEHSASWQEMMQAYQQYREAVFRWINEAETVRRDDLSMELAPLFSCERELHRRLLVVDFMRSTEMWDKRTISLVWKELTQIALAEQEEVAAYAGEALLKIKDEQERFRIADEVFHLAERELQKEEPDYALFGMGCTLLMRLGTAEHFARFCAQYKDQIYLANGLEEADFQEMLMQMTGVVKRER